MVDCQENLGSFSWGQQDRMTAHHLPLLKHAENASENKTLGLCSGKGLLFKYKAYHLCEFPPAAITRQELLSHRLGGQKPKIKVLAGYVFLFFFLEIQDLLQAQASLPAPGGHWHS